MNYITALVKKIKRDYTNALHPTPFICDSVLVQWRGLFQFSSVLFIQSHIYAVAFFGLCCTEKTITTRSPLTFLCLYA